MGLYQWNNYQTDKCENDRWKRVKLLQKSADISHVDSNKIRLGENYFKMDFKRVSYIYHLIVVFVIELFLNTYYFVSFLTLYWLHTWFYTWFCSIKNLRARWWRIRCTLDWSFKFRNFILALSIFISIQKQIFVAKAIEKLWSI